MGVRNLAFAIAEHNFSNYRRVGEYGGKPASKVGAQQAQQMHKPLVVALMRRAGQKHELVSQRTQSFRQAIALRNCCAGYFAQMVGLVKNDDIPRLRAGSGEQRQVVVGLRPVNRHDYLVIAVRGPVPGARDAKILPIDTKRFVKLVLHLVFPLLHHSRRADYQYAPGFTAALFGRQQQAHLNGLAQADIVSDKPVFLVRGHYLVHQTNLMGQGIYIEAVQCASNLVPGIQGVGQRLYSEPFGAVGGGRASPDKPQVFVRNLASFASVL